MFISYAHADNLEVGGRPGWVTQFQEILQPILTSRLKRTKAEIWRDKRLSDNDDFDPVIMKQLPDTAVACGGADRQLCLFRLVPARGPGFHANWPPKAWVPGARRQAAGVQGLQLPPEQQDTLPGPMAKDTWHRSSS